MDYKCSVCQQDVDDDLLVYIKHTEKHIMDEIKAGHPDWSENDGVCQKCVDYYKDQLKGKTVT